MWRAPLRSKFLPISRNLTGARSSKRTFASHIPGVQLHPVPILRPTLWAFAATATIYIGCAAYDVRRDVRDAKRRRLFRDGIVGSYDDFEKAYSSSRFRSRRSSSDDDDDDDESPKWLPMGQIAELFAEHSGAMKFTMGAVALNNVLFLANSFAPGPFMQRFSHIPVSSPNHTMLTSIFVHYGLMHIAVNTWVLFQFAPQVAQSRLFEGNGSHFAAFYLSTGILSSLGEQFATILPTRTYRMNRYARGVGASGVLMAMVAAFVTMHPNAPMHIIFLPWSFDAHQILTAAVLFEAYGLFVGLPFRLGHGAHLAGLALGSAYVYFDGRKRLWRPARKIAFYSMRGLRMI